METYTTSLNGLSPTDVDVLDRIAAWQVHDGELSSHFCGIFIADLISLAEAEGIDAVCTDAKRVRDLLDSAIGWANDSLRIAQKVLAPFPNGHLEPHPAVREDRPRRAENQKLALFLARQERNF